MSPGPNHRLAASVVHGGVRVGIGACPLPHVLGFTYHATFIIPMLQTDGLIHMAMKTSTQFPDPT